MGAGKKFNAKKEETGSYLSIKRYGLHQMLVWVPDPYRTEPKNGDYELEQGATRVFELRKEQTESDEAKAPPGSLKRGTMRWRQSRPRQQQKGMDSWRRETLQAEGQRRRGIGPDDIIHRLHEQHAVGVALARRSVER